MATPTKDRGYIEVRGEDWWQEDRVTTQLREVERKPRFKVEDDAYYLRILRETGVLK